jgi:hypothetical protein
VKGDEQLSSHPREEQSAGGHESVVALADGSMISRPTLRVVAAQAKLSARPVDPDVEVLGGAAKESGIRLDRGLAWGSYGPLSVGERVTDPI